MKKILFSWFLLILLLPFGVRAGEGIHAEGPSWQIGESKPDESLKITESVFDLHFHLSTTGQSKNMIKLSYNGKQKTVALNAEGKYSLMVKPGKYKFQFWYNKQHYEITTDSIAIHPAYRTQLEVYFKSSYSNTPCKKPVIYLYPQEPTQVNVQVETNNPFTFTYPAYDATTGWNIKADPNGKLVQGNKTFNYLFWEGQADMPTQIQQGFVVSKNELTAFLEEKLAHVGLNGIEIQDFITYWVPILQQHEKCRLYFMLNDEYNQYAKLTVTPKPDQLIRLMMLWQPLAPNADTGNIQPQELPHFERKGFTLVEWGGAQMSVPGTSSTTRTDSGY